MTMASRPNAIMAQVCGSGTGARGVTIVELVSTLGSNVIVRNVGSVSRDQAAAVVELPAREGAVIWWSTPLLAPTGALDMGHLRPSTNVGSRLADSSVEAPPTAAGATALHEIGVPAASMNVTGGAAACAMGIVSAPAVWLDIAGAAGAASVILVAAGVEVADDPL